METVYRKMDLDTVFPIQSVKDGLIVSKRGDVTIGWELELPVAFSLTEGGYDDILTAFLSAIRILPPWTMVPSSGIPAVQFFIGRIPGRAGQ